TAVSPSTARRGFIKLATVPSMDMAGSPLSALQSRYAWMGPGLLRSPNQCKTPDHQEEQHGDQDHGRAGRDIEEIGGVETSGGRHERKYHSEHHHPDQPV